MSNETLVELLANGFKAAFEGIGSRSAEEERIWVLKWAQELTKYFPILGQINLAKLSAEEILEIILDLIECCNHYSIFDDPEYIELYFNLNKRSSFISFLEIYLILIILQQNEKVALVCVFDNEDIRSTYNDNLEVFKLIRDNSLHIYNEDTCEHRFIMSVGTAIVQAAKHLVNSDPVLIKAVSKFRLKSNVLSYMTKSVARNLENHPNFLEQIKTIRDKQVESGGADYVITAKNISILLKKPRL